MWIRVNLTDAGYAMINFDHVQRVSPAFRDPNRSYIVFGKGDSILLNESYEELCHKIETYGEIIAEAAEAPLEVRLPPA